MAAQYPPRTSERSQALIEVLALHYRAVLAEALIKGSADARFFEKMPDALREVVKPPKTTLAEKFLKQMAEVDAKTRLRMAQRLMAGEVAGWPQLSAKDRMILKDWVDPKSPVPIEERTGIVKTLAAIFRPSRGLKPTAPDFERAWATELLHDLLPDQLGRPAGGKSPYDAPDQDPRDPDDEEEPQDPQNEGDPTDIFDMPFAGGALEFHLQRVSCVVATRGEWGRDEIAYGGLATQGPLALGSNPDDATTTLITRTDIGDFSHGDSTAISPTRLHRYELDDVQTPHLFAVHFAMAETERRSGRGVMDGSFDAYLERLEDNLNAELGNLMALGTAFAATMVGGTAAIGTLAGPIGTAIGAAVGAIYSGIILLIQYTNQDDIFGLETLPLILAPETVTGAPFFGQSDTEVFTHRCRGDGGTYEIEYFWRLDMPVTPTAPDEDPEV